MTDKYIYLSETKKIQNPIFDPNKCDLESYQGSIEGFNFEHQTNNYLALQKSLDDFKIKLTDIWYGKFTDEYEKPRTHFVVRSFDGNFFWQKYESMAQGSGQNRIYIKGKQYKTTVWLCMTPEDRENLLNL